ncbi:hypothetical protein NQ318_022836 [Aromia moschata]|uniref:Peptidase S1 domain-containing protein n=1 Tax=Aromia moschata TaxID=1265417 RepID=A0AAV8XX26_9CUCU|nr:hypothetical protein NQ318_022836 [Aromia moschata]
MQSIVMETRLSFCSFYLAQQPFLLPASVVQVILGAHRVTWHEATQITFTSRSITNHPSFNSRTFANDLSLVRLPESTILTAAVRLIELAPANSGTFAGSRWRGGVGACNGDSGSPLVVHSMLIGIVSFTADSGCTEGYPTAYARVSAFRTWINSNLEIDWSKITPIDVFMEPVPGAQPQVDTRVVGGTEAVRNSIPYQVALIIDGSGFCGGSLISRLWVLSAAHCTIRASVVQAILGAHNIRNTEATQVIATSRAITNHPSYISSTLANDISLIRLPSQVTLTSAIQIIGLAPASSGTFAGSTGLLSGWGRTSDASNAISATLQRVSLSIITNAVCQSTFGNLIIASTICTSGTGGRGACNGDSGGPIVVGSSQVGIVSFGSGRGCQAGLPTAYARGNKMCYTFGLSVYKSIYQYNWFCNGSKPEREVIRVRENRKIDWSKIKPIDVYVEPLPGVKTTPGSRVVGGSEAAPNSIPYQAALIIDGSGFCGGSLISVDWVLTAAHCTEGASYIEVILGAHNIRDNEPSQVTVTSRALTNHPNYNSVNLNNDIAVIRLPSSVRLTSAIQIVSLAPANSGTFAGSQARLSGWGRTSDSSNSISPTLQTINLNVITNTVCSLVFGSTILSSTICTSGSGGVGSCNGDSGGPLTVEDVQVGVVSLDRTLVVPLEHQVDLPESIDWSKVKPAHVFVEPLTIAHLPSGRVVGGSEAVPNSYPYQAAIITSSGSFCGASVISSEWGLTAAHCTITASFVQIILGAHHVQQVEPNQLVITSSNIINHEDYVSSTLTNDVALLRFPEPIMFNDYIRPVSLAPANSGSFAGSNAVLTGWGRVSDTINTISPTLQEVNLSVITNAVCSQSYSIIRDSTICTSGVGYVGSCNGDSGGPLVVNGVQVGVCSFGSLSGCQAAQPSGFARVDWSKIKPEYAFIEPINDITYPSARVIGGTEAVPNALPYQVAVFMDTGSFCGGSLISNQWVLSAAHCTIRQRTFYSSAWVQVVLGAHNIRNNEATQVTVVSSSIVNHPQYIAITLTNDISLIRLQSPVTFSNAIRAINLAPASSGTFAGSDAVLSGWGRTSEASNVISPTLQRVTLNVITNNVCANTYGTSVIRDSTICTSGVGIVGACQGDSGGPLVVNNVQVGVTSFVSARGCQSGLPSGFARVSSFRDWIAQTSGV